MHAAEFEIDSVDIAEEYTTWKRLLRYHRTEVMEMAVGDVVWLKSLLRHGRVGGRSWRWAVELMLRIEPENFASFLPARQIRGGW